MSDNVVKVGQIEIRYLVDGSENGGLGVFELEVLPARWIACANTQMPPERPKQPFSGHLLRREQFSSIQRTGRVRGWAAASIRWCSAQRTSPCLRRFQAQWSARRRL